MKILNLLGTAATVLILGGITIAYIYSETSSIVRMALFFSILGALIELGVKVFNRGILQELSLAESSELSIHNTINRYIEKGQPVPSDLLSDLNNASTNAEEKYKKIYGFYRPAMAMKANASINIG